MRWILTRALILLWLMPMVISCGQSSEPAISFYYWRTTFNLSDAENDAVIGNQARRLYVRYFDVDVDAEVAFPRAPVRFAYKPGTDVIPVVFIKNRVFLSNPNIEELARKILGLVDTIDESVGITTAEIQFDCDWTTKTREAYFKFLETVKARSEKNLSATIRLHQVKYFDKTGVPPVNRGVLMYYNMSAIESGERNSIYDRKTAKRYLAGIDKYPLMLDLALPIYGWGVHIRNGRPIGLRRKEDLSGIDTNSVFIKGVNEYSISKNLYFHGTFYKKGDILKIETVSDSQLLEMAKDLSEAGFSPYEVIFYDLDQFNLNRYEKDIFSETVGGF